MGRPPVRKCLSPSSHKTAELSAKTIDLLESAGIQTIVFKGPLLWLAERLGKNRERAGLH